MNLRLPLVTMILTLTVMGIAQPVWGQFREDFESATPTWKRSSTDCLIQESKWSQRRANEIETRNRFERIEFQNGPGTRIYVAHEVAPAFIIPELVPSIRIRASRPGQRFMVRVVLPHTPAPSGEGPMTTLLAGPRYRNTGKWETLSFSSNRADLQKQLQEEVWMLRQKLGPEVDARDAYIDKIVLNLYSGAGKTQVEIDDLVVNGIVSAENVVEKVATLRSVNHDPNVRPTGAQSNDGEPVKQKSIVIRDGTVLLVRKAPFFPRIIQHNGEPFDYLKAIGFNTVELKATPTKEQLEEAEKQDLWLIAPAPASVGLSPIGFEFDRVLAWSVGEDLGARNLAIVQQRVREIRESDLRDGRPIVGHAASSWSAIARQTDILATGVRPIGTSFLASQYSEWIKQRSEAIGNSKPIWAEIQTELSPALSTQIASLAQTSPPIPIEPQQIKLLVMEAITGGARGLRFVSRSRLDAVDPVTRLRALTLQWINAELTQIEPWAVGGALFGEVPLDNPNLEVTAINTNRSRLLVIQRPTHREQYVAGDVPVTTVTFKDSSGSSTDTAYLITEAGLVTLPNSRSFAGTQIQIENCPAMALVVLTQDPLVVSNLTQSYERVGRQSILQLKTELTQQWLAIMQLIDNQLGRMGRKTAAASGALNEAVNAFRQGQGLIRASSPQAALEFVHRTEERLAFMRREMISGPLGKFQSKISSPFVVHCSLLPHHWELASRLADGQWNPNGLAGGDFESLSHMMANGWQNRRLDNEILATTVELSDQAVVDGKYGLKMTVKEKTPSSKLVQATPLWVATPNIRVKSGQLVRIHGWVNVPQVILGTHNGLTITDSLGGPDMAERVPITQGWQEFTLYRGVPENGTVRVTFALDGIGEAMIDEVTIRTFDLPPPGPRQARNQ